MRFNARKDFHRLSICPVWRGRLEAGVPGQRLPAALQVLQVLVAFTYLTLWIAGLAPAMAFAHTIASARGVTRAAVLGRAAVRMLPCPRRQQCFGERRRSYNSVSSRRNAGGAAKARRNDGAADPTAAAALRRWPSRAL